MAEAVSPSGRLAVVVGGTGGVGAALAAALVGDPTHDRVIVLSRRPPAEAVAAEARERLVWIAADILDEASLAEAARQISALGSPDLILIATGLLHGEGLAPEKSLRSLNAEALTRVLQVNAVGPALVAKHLLPLTPRDRPSVLAALSARVGSIGDNQLGGWYGYRASKAALNMLIRTLAIEHRRTRPLGVCVVLHPGTVATALSAPFQTGVPDGKLFTPEQSAAALLAVVAGLGPEANGGFFAWDGSPIAW